MMSKLILLACALFVSQGVVATAYASPGTVIIQFESLRILSSDFHKDEPPTANPLPGRAILEIAFTVTPDLQAFAAQHGLNVGSDAVLCDAGAALQNYPFVFGPTGRVDPFRLESRKADALVARKTIYRIYVAVRSVPLAGQDVFAYDLRDAPKDICVKVRGGRMTGAHFESNVITLSESVIHEAISHSE